MASWKSLPPTPNQVKAIESYNLAYGVKIHVNNKQDAHNVISVFCPVQKLEFNDTYINGTDVSYEVVNEKLFSCYRENNKNRLKNVTDIKIKDGEAIITVIKKNNKHDVLKSLQLNMNKLQTESLSEYEDSLGCLDENNLNREMDLYGSDPMWWE